jgi:hypothetical protein
MTWFQADKEAALKKGIAVCFFCLIMLVAGIFPRADSSGQDIPTFSNKDLERYKSPPDETPFQTTGWPAAKQRTQRAKNYWCSLAGDYQKKIDSARDRAKDVEKLASNENGDQAFSEIRFKKLTRRKDEKAKKDLKEAERELQYLEEDAHREDMPPDGRGAGSNSCGSFIGRHVWTS